MLKYTKSRQSDPEMTFEQRKPKMNKFAAPEFAMSFTQEAVLLERRNGQDWQSLGDARYMSGNIATKLNSLRGDNGNERSGPDTVLVIPDEQILYTTLTVPPGSDMPAMIGRALEGMTPYKAEDLVFDWCPDENGQIDSLRVAAVARITLKEAEEFARAQGFQPLGFEARPGDGRFAGQPDFGLSQLAREQQRVVPFSKPSLQQAGVTSDRIEIEEEPVDIPPTITRIIPHVHAAPASPAPVMKAPVSDGAKTEKEAAPKADRGKKPVGAAVIRHGEARAIAASPTMSERARAVHARAAEARAQRADNAEDTDKIAVAGMFARFKGVIPSTLTIMMGLLVASLLAAWLFMGGSDEAPNLATRSENSSADEAAPENAATEDAAETVQAEVSPPAEAETSGLTIEAITEPETPDAADDMSTDTITTADEASTAQTLDDPEGTADQSDQLPTDEETPPQDALTAALNEAISGQSTDNGAAAGDNSAPDAATDETAQNLSDDLSDAATDAARDAVTADTTDGDSAQSTATTVENTGNTEENGTAAANQLSSSARPPSDRPELQAPTAASDSRPTVPSDPQPYEQRAEPEPVQLTGQRPPSRSQSQPTPEPQPAAESPETSAPPAPPPAASDASSNDSSVPTSPRPAPRPGELTFLEEGSAREPDQRRELTQDEREFVEGLLHELRTAQAGTPELSEAERGAVIRLAQARPETRPLPVSGPSEEAVQDALESALSASERPEPRASTAKTPPPPPSSANETDRSALLKQSARPAARPGGSASSSLAKDAIEGAIASAVKDSSASPGSVGLAALTSSAIPPRRSENIGSNASAADDSQEQAVEQQRAEELAEQRRRDAELQAQAERRARERAAADARAEAQARAAAEARARAQAEAEARAAAARNQRYTPPEAEKEPEVSGPIPDGRTRTTAAATATVKDGIPLKSTQIIGTIGAGKASRALVRLSNGKVITLRLGDKINGGRITAIGDSRITYVEGGQSKQLSVLSGK